MKQETYYKKTEKLLNRAKEFYENAAVVVTVSVIHMQNYVFLMLLNT